VLKSAIRFAPATSPPGLSPTERGGKKTRLIPFSFSLPRRRELEERVEVDYRKGTEMREIGFSRL